MAEPKPETVSYYDYYEALYTNMFEPDESYSSEEVKDERLDIKNRFVADYSRWAYHRLHTMVLRDGGDIRNMDQELARIVYER